MSTCRSCGAEIIWAETASGKRIPMDAEPVTPKGLFILRHPDDFTEPPEAVSVASQQAVTLYQSHFATCPEAEGWRK